MADDDDVRGAPSPEELFAPTGPRRSSFTPPPDDAETREAAAILFDDDDIAAALSAEFARVASGPIPIQRPPVEQAPVEQAPVEQAPVEQVPVEQVPVEQVIQTEEPAAQAPEPVADPPASYSPQSSWAPPPPAEPEQQPVEPEPQPVEPEPTEPEPQPAEPEAEAAGFVPPPVQPGPPDWATPLFGQPQPSAQAEPVSPPASDPFAPSAPSFAPSNGPFPPPGASAPEPSTPSAVSDAGTPPLTSADADVLRALYASAPAPTVPAADAPPPPGYDAPDTTAGAPSVGSPAEPGDLRPRRRALPDDTPPTRSPIEELQAQLDERDREGREYAAWESSMLAVGTPESLAAVDEARAERSGMPPSAPVASPPAATEEPAAFLAPPAEEPAAFFPSPVEEPAAFPAPPVEEPASFLPPPADEPAAFLAPPVEEPAAFLAPPVEEPAAFLPPPVEEPASFLAPPAEQPAAFLPPPAEEPAAFLAPPVEEPAEDDPFDIFSAAINQPDESAAPPSNEATTFPGFGPPTDATTTDFAAPSDPRELSFDNSSQPDTPVFLEPVPAASVPSAPSGPPSWNLDEPVDAGEPPALVEPPTPDGVSDLWRAASEGEPSAPSDSMPVPTSAAPEPAPPPSAEIPPPPSTGLPHGFDDLLSGSAEPEPQPPNSAWIAEQPGTVPEPASDPEAEDRRPFGEGVDRDEAIDPSESILGASPEHSNVSTAAIVLAAPKASQVERSGLEPTPVEQRVGRAARLFWLWFAANSSIAAIVFGTIIFALGVSLRQAIVATLAGVALSFLPLGLGTLAGKRSGQPTMVISRATFGIVGNILPSLIALFSRLFWAAGLLWVLGAGTADILTGAKLTDGFTTGQLTIVFMAIGFIVAVVLAYFGYGLIAWVQLVISVISGIAIVGFILLTLQYVNFTTALSTQDGPWILVVTGAVLVFSFVGLAWANSSSDVARYQRPDSSGAASMLWATFGVAVPSFILIAYGALLAASNPTLATNIAADPLDSLGRLLPLWYPAPLLAATGLSLLSGIVLAIYSGGFALGATGLRLRRSLSTLIVGVLVLLIAIIMSSALTDFSQLFRDLATTVAVPVAAWAGIFGSEIMIRRRRFDSRSLLSRGGVYEDVRWGNLIALVAISVIGYGFLSASLSGLTWEGYLFSLTAVPLNSALATSDLGVLVALVLGLLYPLVAGRSGIRAQESATRSPE